MDSEKSLKYGLYARKSSESDEKQTLSINSQLSEMQSIASKNNLQITKTYKEKHSAKQSRSRPRFIELMSDLENGFVNAIIVWAPDRLSRNAGDLGDLVDLMDKGKLWEIRTYNQIFSNTPNHKFLLMILCSQAKLENDNRAINIKRGIRNKYTMGWLPRPAPVGYMNLRVGGEAKIILDKQRADYIKQIFKKVGLEGMNVRDLRAWINDDTQFRTKNDAYLSKSLIYSILRNPFYYGKLTYKGKLLDGKHPPVITKELFDKVQNNLKPLRKISWNHRSQVSISKFIKCGACGDNIIEWHKNRKLKSGKYRKHIYFRCSRFKDPLCKQPSISYFNLIKQMANLIRETDVVKVRLPSDIKKEIINYYFVNIISTQDPNSIVLALRSQNICFSEIDANIVRAYFRFVLLCKAVEKKVKLLEAVKISFVLMNGTLFVNRINQA